MCGCVKFCAFAHLQGLINECYVPAYETQSPCCVKKCKCTKIRTFAHMQLQNKECYVPVVATETPCSLKVFKMCR